MFGSCKDEHLFLERVSGRRHGPQLWTSSSNAHMRESRGFGCKKMGTTHDTFLKVKCAAVRNLRVAMGMWRRRARAAHSRRIRARQARRAFCCPRMGAHALQPDILLCGRGWKHVAARKHQWKLRNGAYRATPARANVCSSM